MLTSLSLSRRLELQSVPLESGLRLSGLGVRNGAGDGADSPVPTFRDWSGVMDIICSKNISQILKKIKDKISLH